MWKIYLVGIALFPCLYYVFCDTSSDDGPYRSPFDTELLQVLRQISTNLNVISENTERNWNLQFNAEMNKIKTQNRKLKNNLKKILNETATEKKRAQDMGAEITNIKQENRKLKNDLHDIQNETAIEKKRSQEMEKILTENIKELQNLTLNLQRGSIAANNQFRINQDGVNKDISKRLQTLEGKSDVHGIYSFRPKDCQGLRSSGKTLDGVHSIYPSGSSTYVSVYCDMTDGGWTVFQRRMDGRRDFYRNWHDYKYGFGNAADEYWLGNKYLHQLTKNRSCQMKIDLTNLDNVRRYAQYEDFSIGNETDNYRLHIGNYTGNIGYDSLKYHNNMEFTTKDRDHDSRSGGNCAVDHKGAWWYGNCANSNLNGEYGRRDNKGVWWYGYPSSPHMKATTMKMKCK